MSMLLRFAPEDIPRVATDSIYIRKELLDHLTDDYIDNYNDEVLPGLWRDKGEEILRYRAKVNYNPLPEHFGTPIEHVSK